MVEAALKEGVALQELHLEEIREGLVWLCTNAMWIGLLSSALSFLLGVLSSAQVDKLGCAQVRLMSLLACKKLAIDGWELSTYPSQKV